MKRFFQCLVCILVFTLTTILSGCDSSSISSTNLNDLHSIIEYSIAGNQVKIIGYKIYVTVPNDTNLTNLKAQFKFLGKSISVDGRKQISGVTTNNFTVPVQYMVVSTNGRFSIYTVIVAKPPVITFSLQDMPIVINTSTTAIVKLRSNVKITDFPVIISSKNPAIAKAGHQGKCIITSSIAPHNTCTIKIHGISKGNTTLTASCKNCTSVTQNINVLASSWQLVGGITPTNSLQTYISSMVVDRSGNVYVSTNGAGKNIPGSIYKSTLGGPWQQIIGSSPYSTPDACSITSLYLDHDQNNLYAGTNCFGDSAGSVWKFNANSFFQTAKWSCGSRMPDGGQVTSIALSSANNNIYAGTSNSGDNGNGPGSVFICPNDGVGYWTHPAKSIPDGGSIYQIAADNNISDQCFVSSSLGNIYQVYQGVDAKAGWDIVGQKNPYLLPPTNEIVSTPIAIANTVREDSLYAGLNQINGEGSIVSVVIDIFPFDTWNYDYSPENSSINTIAITGSTNADIYIGTNFGVLHLDEYNSIWQNVGGYDPDIANPNISFIAISVDKFGKQTVYAATSNNVYKCLAFCHT